MRACIRNYPVLASISSHFQLIHFSHDPASTCIRRWYTFFSIFLTVFCMVNSDTCTDRHIHAQQHYFNLSQRSAHTSPIFIFRIILLIHTQSHSCYTTSHTQVVFLSFVVFSLANHFRV